MERVNVAGKRAPGQPYPGQQFFDIVVHRKGGRYICGEGTAQINALMGKRAHPQQSPPRSTEKGLWDKPTVLNNMETLVNVPHILRNGAEWFKNLAKTKTAAGTKLYCVSGKVKRPGCYELPMGTRLSEIIEEHAGGLLPGSNSRRAQGGASTCFLGKED
jgi:NADH-quinone oxidoreductase subunit F